MTEYVTTADALFFHKQLIERYGGAPGLREAAALLEGLVQNHPFVDGNKRVAFGVVDVFLRINGYSITADSKAIYDHMIKLVEARAFDMEHLVPWLQEIVRPRA